MRRLILPVPFGLFIITVASIALSSSAKNGFPFPAHLADHFLPTAAASTYAEDATFSLLSIRGMVSRADDGSALAGVTMTLSGAMASSTVTDTGRSLTVSPGNSSYQTGIATFGPQAFDVTAQVALASPSDGCSSISGVSGRIAIVDRGTCTYVVKAANVQAAGGIGIIVVDSIAGASPPAMPGTGTVTIAAMSVTQADGNTIKAQIAAGATNARMFRSSTNYSFAGLTPGAAYTVTPQLAGFVFTPASRTYNNLQAEEANANFTATAAVSISGRVSMANGRGVTNARVTISGGGLAEPITVMTGRLGRYSFENLAAQQTYTVTAVQPRFTISPPSQTVTPAGSLTNVDFTAAPN